jgi:hypothetical protein
VLKKFIESITMFIASFCVVIFISSSVLLAYSFIFEQLKNNPSFPGLILASVIVAAWCTHDCVLASNK